MRNISFALTTEQVRNQTKTVTRRLGWKNLTPGTLLQPVVKSQGIKKGEKVTKIGGPIRVVSVTREPLIRIAERSRETLEMQREGFPGDTGSWFVRMFREANGCGQFDEVTRIEFTYTEAKG